ncbi:MAG: tetratricopeptide repeat protein [bacterium]
MYINKLKKSFASLISLCLCVTGFPCLAPNSYALAPPCLTDTADTFNLIKTSNPSPIKIKPGETQKRKGARKTVQSVKKISIPQLIGPLVTSDTITENIESLLESGYPVKRQSQRFFILASIVIALPFIAMLALGILVGDISNLFSGSQSFVDLIVFRYDMIVEYALAAITQDAVSVSKYFTSQLINNNLLTAVGIAANISKSNNTLEQKQSQIESLFNKAIHDKKIFGEIIQWCDQELKTLSKEDPICLLMLMYKGNVLFFKEQYSEASEVYYELIKRAKEPIPLEDSIWSAYRISKAMEVYQTKGDVAATLKIFSEETQRCGDNYLPFWHIARINIMQNDLDNAEKDYLILLSLLKDSYGVQPIFKQSEYMLNLFEPGLSSQVLITVDACYFKSTALVKLGAISEKSNKLEEAERHYYEAIAVDPKCIDAYYKLLSMKLKQGLRNEAERIINELDYPEELKGTIEFIFALNQGDYGKARRMLADILKSDDHIWHVYEALLEHLTVQIKRNEFFEYIFSFEEEETLQQIHKGLREYIRGEILDDKDIEILVDTLETAGSSSNPIARKNARFNLEEIQELFCSRKSKKAYNLILKGEFEAAVNIYRELEKIQPLSVDVNLHYGLVLLERRECAKGIVRLQRALRHCENKEVALIIKLKLAIAYLISAGNLVEKGNIKSGYKYLEKAFEIETETSLEHEYDQNKVVKASRHNIVFFFNEFIDVLPTHSDLCEQHIDNFNNLLTQFKEQKPLKSTTPALIHYALAELYLAKSRNENVFGYIETFKYFETALKLTPKDPEIRRTLQFFIYQARAEAFSECYAVRMAKKDIEECLKIGLSEYDPSVISTVLGFFQAQVNEYSDAIKTLNAVDAAVLKGDLLITHTAALAISYFELGDFESSERLFEEVKTILEENQEIEAPTRFRLDLSRFLLHQGRLDEAEREVERASRELLENINKASFSEFTFNMNNLEEHIDEIAVKQLLRLSELLSIMSRLHHSRDREELALSARNLSVKLAKKDLESRWKTRKTGVDVDMFIDIDSEVLFKLAEEKFKNGEYDFWIMLTRELITRKFAPIFPYFSDKFKLIINLKKLSNPLRTEIKELSKESVKALQWQQQKARESVMTPEVKKIVGDVLGKDNQTYVDAAFKLLAKKNLPSDDVVEFFRVLLLTYFVQTRPGIMNTLSRKEVNSIIRDGVKDLDIKEMRNIEFNLTKREIEITLNEKIFDNKLKRQLSSVFGNEIKGIISLVIRREGLEQKIDTRKKEWWREEVLLVRLFSSICIEYIYCYKPIIIELLGDEFVEYKINELTARRLWNEVMPALLLSVSKIIGAFYPKYYRLERVDRMIIAKTLKEARSCSDFQKLLDEEAEKIGWQKPLVEIAIGDKKICFAVFDSKSNETKEGQLEYDNEIVISMPDYTMDGAFLDTYSESLKQAFAGSGLSEVWEKQRPKVKLYSDIESKPAKKSKAGVSYELENKFAKMFEESWHNVVESNNSKAEKVLTEAANSGKLDKSFVVGKLVYKAFFTDQEDISLKTRTGKIPNIVVLDLSTWQAIKKYSLQRPDLMMFGTGPKKTAESNETALIENIVRTLICGQTYSFENSRNYFVYNDKRRNKIMIAVINLNGRICKIAEFEGYEESAAEIYIQTEIAPRYIRSFVNILQGGKKIGFDRRSEGILDCSSIKDLVSEKEVKRKIYWNKKTGSFICSDVDEEFAVAIGKNGISYWNGSMDEIYKEYAESDLVEITTMFEKLVNVAVYSNINKTEKAVVQLKLLADPGDSN